MEEREIVEEWKSLKKAVFYTNLHSTIEYKEETGNIIHDKTAFSADEIAQFWLSAGVHRYSSPGTVVYAGHRWVTIHSGTGGERIIEWPGDFVVKDFLNEHQVPSNKGKSLVDLKAGETRIFELSPKIN